MLNSYSLCQDVCVRVVVGQVREKVLQWTDSNVTLAYFTKELQAEADRLFRLQGRYQGFGAVLFWGGSRSLFCSRLRSRLQRSSFFKILLELHKKCPK